MVLVVSRVIANRTGRKNMIIGTVSLGGSDAAWQGMWQAAQVARVLARL
jgi:hypothetical protein